MFNVLPLQLKKEIAKEYSYRRITVIAACILFIELCMLILLTPSWLVSSYKEEEVRNQIDQVAKTSTSKNIDFISLLITSTNAKLHVLDTAPDVRLIPIIDDITERRGQGLQITQLSYASQKTGATVMVGGIATNRDALLTFVKSLRSSEKYKKVDVPLSNFADDTDIHFNITVTISS